MRYCEIIAKEAENEAGIIKPMRPLTPAQAAREAERKAKLQKRINDQESFAAEKLSDLRAELVRQPT
jgi:hypothetical protein